MNNIKDVLLTASDEMGWNEKAQLENVLNYLQQLANDNGDILTDFNNFIEERKEFEKLD